MAFTVYNGKRIGAIIPAAGIGQRMKRTGHKQFLTVGGKEILEWTLYNLMKTVTIDEVWIIAPQASIEELKDKIKRWNILYDFNRPIHVRPGGETRQASVFKGLSYIDNSVDWVVVHDGVRPFVDSSWLENNLHHMSDSDAVVAAIPSIDTLKQVDERGYVVSTLDRSCVWQIQTPQVFVYKELLAAHYKAIESMFEATDDAGLVERLGYKVMLCEANRNNIKITTPEDLVFAEAIINSLKAGDL